MSLLPVLYVHSQLCVPPLTTCTCSFLRQLFFGYWSRVGSIWSLCILTPATFIQQVVNDWLLLQVDKTASRKGNIWGGFYPQDQAQAGASCEIMPLLSFFCSHILLFLCPFQFLLNKPLSSKCSHIRICMWKHNLGCQVNPIPGSHQAWECKTFLQP